MQERRKDLADKLENGLKEMYASDKYAEYLKTMSKFPHYSRRNTLLIHMQMPGASRVAGASKWKSDFKRHPKKGEKAIYIYAPVKNDKEPEKKMFEKIDPETGAPMLDKDGKIIMEEMTALDLSRMRYRPAPVFDVSQTDGKALPEIVSPLNGDVERYDALLDALKATSPLPIEFEKMSDNQDGYCRYGEKIGIREGMSERQTVAAIVHEIAHARLHDKANIPEGEAKKSRNVKELEAESVAFAICEKYGVNSGANSFGYLATWAGHDPEMKQLKASLDTIQKEVGSLSRELDVHYAAALKNRGLEAEQAQGQSNNKVEEKSTMGQWSQGEMACPVTREIYRYWVKHFEEGSKYGIDGGNISKLCIRKLGDNLDLCNYDRGWDLPPVEEVKDVYALIMQKYDLRTQSEIAAAEEEAAIHADEREKALHDIGVEQLEPPMPFDMGPKEYSLGFGYTGSVNSPDGIEVWNWADEKPEGGYTVVANISTEREVTFVDENMPDSVKDEIFDKANTAVMQDEDRSECKFVAATNLPDGWRWQQWDDGSGSLQSPDGESVAGYDLSTSEYQYKGKWNFMAGYPSDTESFTGFKASMESRVRADRGIDEAALSAEQPQTAQEKTEAPADYLPEWYDNPPDNGITVAEQIEYGYSDYDNMLPLTQQRAIDLFERGVQVYLLYQDGTESAADDVSHIKGHDGIFGVESEDWVNSAVFKEEKAKSADNKIPETPPLGIGDYVVTGADAIISGHGRITGLANDDYPGSKEHFVVDFGDAGTCTVHKNDMVLESEPNVVVSSSLPEPTMSTFTVYKEDFPHAVENGEMETYYQSSQLNYLCRDTIDKAISDNRQSIEGAPAGACTYDMKAAVWSVIGECGRDRAEWVLAANINSAVAVNDGRISSQNREWAENTGAPEKHDYHIQAHKTLIDGFARRFRESEKEKPPMSFLYAQAQQRQKAAEAQKSGGDVEQSGHKKSEER